VQPIPQHKSVLRQTKGFRGRAKNCFTIAIRRLQKAWQYAYRDRKVQKRNWRKLWIARLNAGVRQYDCSYSQFIPAMKEANIHLNRKVLSELAANEPFSFKAILDVVKMRSSMKNN
jgi:large subunit ribosomal protein L20